MPPGVGFIIADVSGLPARGGTLVSLLSLQMISGTRAYFGSMNIEAPALLTLADVGGLTTAAFQNKLLQAPSFKAAGTVATATSSVTIENVSGNTVERDGSVLLASEELWGAWFIYQLWSPQSEVSKVINVGTVQDAEDNIESLRLTLKSYGNWSEIKAPDKVISPNCNLTFGTLQCGSTASDPCHNDWGTCTAHNRFNGLVSQWATGNISELPAVAYAQPAPFVQINQRRIG